MKDLISTGRCRSGRSKCGLDARAIYEKESSIETGMELGEVGTRSAGGDGSLGWRRDTESRVATSPGPSACEARGHSSPRQYRRRILARCASRRLWVGNVLAYLPRGLRPLAYKSGSSQVRARLCQSVCYVSTDRGRGSRHSASFDDGSPNRRDTCKLAMGLSGGRRGIRGAVSEVVVRLQMG